MPRRTYETGEAKEGRYPRFSDAYRQRWVDAGLWADRTLHDLFDETVAERRDLTAVVTKDRRVTFGELEERSRALAAGFVANGTRPGDIVAVLLPNWLEFVELQLALSRAGAVIMPLHTVYREREVRHLMRFCGTDVAVAPESFGGVAYADIVRAAWPDLDRLRHLVVVRGEAQGERETGYEDLVKLGQENLDVLASVETSPDDVFYLNFTSGTEGDPKGFLHTHNTLISLFNTLSKLLARMSPGLVNLCCSPMTHSFGHFTTYQMALGGIPMVIVDKYRPTDVLELLEREKVTAISGTPAHLHGLLHHPDFAKYDTSSVKSVSVGGARSNPTLLAELEQTWGVKSANTYGMGETILHTRTMPFDSEEKTQDTVGRPAFGSELKIVDPSDRACTLPVGRVGEIAFRGPTLFVGYHEQPDRTAETRDDEGWFYTGDLGFTDEDGYLHFAGRAKEVINRGGTKIHPREVEDLLAGHPGVDDIAVVPMPHDRFGEVVCAYVVPAPGAEVTLDSLREHLLAQGAMRYFAPEHLVVVDEFPMTPTGKVRKAALMDDAAARAQADGTSTGSEAP